MFRKPLLYKNVFIPHRTNKQILESSLPQKRRIKKVLILSKNGKRCTC
jgi:uroporphyrinogen-III synthase